MSEVVFENVNVLDTDVSDMNIFDQENEIEVPEEILILEKRLDDLYDELDYYDNDVKYEDVNPLVVAEIQQEIDEIEKELDEFYL